VAPSPIVNNTQAVPGICQLWFSGRKNAATINKPSTPASSSRRITRLNTRPRSPRSSGRVEVTAVMAPAVPRIMASRSSTGSRSWSGCSEIANSRQALAPTTNVNGRMVESVTTRKVRAGNP